MSVGTVISSGPITRIVPGVREIFLRAGHPGGGVETGVRAQEETICRRSTLTCSLYSFDPTYAHRYGYPLQLGNHYPIISDFSAIYSPGVTVFRKGLDCLFMEEPYDVAVVTCAAQNLNGKYPIRPIWPGFSTR